MKRIFIIAAPVLVAISLVLYFFLKKGKTATNGITTNNITPTNGVTANSEINWAVAGNPPAYPLTQISSAPTGSTEDKLCGSMRWLNTNKVEWIMQVKNDYSFTWNQALAYIAINQLKSGKEIPLDYAGTTNLSGHVDWVKKYVK